MDTHTMVETVNRYIKALCEHDISAIEDLFDDGATVEDPAGSEPRTGMAAIRELYLNAFALDIKAELLGSVRCADNAAVFPFYVTLNRDGALMRLEPIDVFEFNDNGKIRSMKAYWGPENCSPI